MAGTIQCGRRSRKDFGKIPSIVEIPNLIEVQKRSYETFLQKDVPADRREDVGLQAVFKSVFPIADYNDNALLEFDSYHFGDPKYTVEECHDRGMTFAIPLKVTLRLVVFDHDKEAKTKTIREQRGQEVYLGELPLMTEKGTFIINGTERVVVRQLQRSAGVFFDDDKGKTLASGKPLYSVLFFFSSRRRHTRLVSDWSSDVCSSDLLARGSGLVSSKSGRRVTRAR